MEKRKEPGMEALGGREAKEGMEASVGGTPRNKVGDALCRPR